jgi:hypothetical protein
MARTLQVLTARDADADGRVSLASMQARVNFWATSAAVASCKHLAAAAQRLLTMHTTSCASERNWSVWGQIYTKTRSRLAIERAEKLVFIKQNYTAPGGAADSGADWEVLLRILEEEEPQGDQQQPAASSAGPSDA